MSRRGRVAGRGGALAVVASAVLLGGASLPASAGSGAGEITLTAAEPRGGDAAELEVCVTFVLDGDQAATARVTASAEGPGGATVPATTLSRSGEPGSRSGTLTFPDPGSWTVTVASTFPPGELVVPVSIGGGPLVQPGAAGEGDCGPPTIEVASGVTAPTSTTAAGATSAAGDPATSSPANAGDAGGGDDYQGSGAWLVVTGVLVAAFIALGAGLDRRRRAAPGGED